MEVIIKKRFLEYNLILEAYNRKGIKLKIVQATTFHHQNLHMIYMIDLFVHLKVPEEASVK
uniref:Uncharacterized protein n=1 Tax=Glycine max TaxID=3847 RepID=C6T9X0_SOYBN|nr:unknown [Glycine max]